MGNAACVWLGINPLGGRLVSTTTTNMNVSFCGCMHVVDYVVEYIHIFDT
jgi:hypothetical protein